MLVLTRKLQEKITIGGNITITVLRVKGTQVRIGIEAPRDVRVVRGELPMTTEQELPAGADKSGSQVVESVAELPLPTKVRQIPTTPRLPQRRPFARNGQPPLRRVSAAHIPMMAK